MLEDFCHRVASIMDTTGYMGYLEVIVGDYLLSIQGDDDMIIKWLGKHGIIWD